MADEQAVKRVVKTVRDVAGSAYAGAWQWVGGRLQRSWNQAAAAGLVEGELEAAIDRAASIALGRPVRSNPTPTEQRDLNISNETLAALEELGSLSSADVVDEWVRRLFGALKDDLDIAYSRAEALEWTTEQYEEAVEQLARRYGGGDVVDAETPVANLIDQVATRTPFDTGNNQVLRADQVKLLHPYMRHRIRGINTRPNHEVLDGFVWRTGWRFEHVVIPPHGWNCFCRVEPVDWLEAELREWEGDTPLGEEKFLEFVAIGGEDKGFIKSDFVVMEAVA